MSAQQNHLSRYAPPSPYRPAAAWPLATRPNSPVLLMWLALGLSLTVLFAAVALLILAWAIQLYQSDRVIPGVRVLGVRVGGLSTSQVTALLQQQWQQQTIVLQAGEITYSANPAMLGISLEAKATARAAYGHGRSLNMIKETIEAIAGPGVLPVVKLDPVTAEKNLEALAPRFETRPINAGVRIADGRAQVTPSTDGQTLDVAATVERLKQYASHAMRDGRLTAVTTPVQPVINDVRAVNDMITQLPVGRLSMRAFDPVVNQVITLTVEPERWTSWLDLSADSQDSTRLRWRVDAERAKGWWAIQSARLGAERYLKVDEATAAIEKAAEARNLNVAIRIYHRERQHTVQPGETLAGIAYDYGLPYPWLQRANPEIGNTLAPGQAIKIPSPDVLLPLPAVENKRILVSLSQQKLWAYENGAIKWEWPVSTGVASSPTWPGVFQVQSHEPNAYAANWNLHMPYFMGIYRPAPDADFMNGLHGFPSRNGSQVLWTNSLGKPVTYGCILVSTENATLLYKWAEAGVVVEIRP